MVRRSGDGRARRRLAQRPWRGSAVGPGIPRPPQRDRAIARQRRPQTVVGGPSRYGAGHRHEHRAVPPGAARRPPLWARRGGRQGLPRRLHAGAARSRARSSAGRHHLRRRHRRGTPLSRRAALSRPRRAGRRRRRRRADWLARGLRLQGLRALGNRDPGPRRAFLAAGGGHRRHRDRRRSGDR